MFSCNKPAMKSQQMKLFETNGNFQLLIRLICELILPIPHRLAHNTGHSPTHFTHWSQINIFRILEIRNCKKKKINTLPVLSITDHCRTRTNKMSNKFFFFSKQSRHLILTRINNQKSKPFIFMNKHYRYRVSKILSKIFCTVVTVRTYLPCADNFTSHIC